MSNVFNIISQYDVLMAQIEELGGEITPEIASQLIINENELANKVRAYYYIIKTKESEINLAKEEQERLGDVRKVKDNLIKRLKKTVDLAVETFGVLKPSGAKGLDLGDLKVWQKKTEALEIEGTINDDRFCYKTISIIIPYNKEEEFFNLIKDFEFWPYNGKDGLVEDISLDRDKLKQWLLDNEEEHKKLKSEYEEKRNAPNTFFEEIEQEIETKEPTPEEIIKDKDLKVVLAVKINHNSTVVFK